MTRGDGAASSWEAEEFRSGTVVTGVRVDDSGVSAFGLAEQNGSGAISEKYTSGSVVPIEDRRNLFRTYDQRMSEAPLRIMLDTTSTA